jgi:hypothetical protein
MLPTAENALAPGCCKFCCSPSSQLRSVSPELLSAVLDEAVAPVVSRSLISRLNALCRPLTLICGESSGSLSALISD